jgi:hypothetical protein
MLFRPIRSTLLTLAGLWILFRVVLPAARYLQENGDDPKLNSVRTHLQNAADDASDWALEQVQKRYLTPDAVVDPDSDGLNDTKPASRAGNKR